MKQISDFIAFDNIQAPKIDTIKSALPIADNLGKIEDSAENALKEYNKYVIAGETIFRNMSFNDSKHYVSDLQGKLNGLNSNISSVIRKNKFSLPGVAEQQSILSTNTDKLGKLKFDEVLVDLVADLACNGLGPMKSFNLDLMSLIGLLLALLMALLGLLNFGFNFSFGSMSSECIYASLAKGYKPIKSAIASAFSKEDADDVPDYAKSKRSVESDTTDAGVTPAASGDMPAKKTGALGKVKQLAKMRFEDIKTSQISKINQTKSNVSNIFDNFSNNSVISSLNTSKTDITLSLSNLRTTFDGIPEFDSVVKDIDNMPIDSLDKAKSSMLATMEKGKSNFNNIADKALADNSIDIMKDQVTSTLEMV